MWQESWDLLTERVGTFFDLVVLKYAKEQPIQTQFMLLGFLCFLALLLGPIIMYFWRHIVCLCHPLMLPYKHVLITGGGSGLGKALASEIFRRGAYITLIGLEADLMKQAAEAIEVSSYRLKFEGTANEGATGFLYLSGHFRTDLG